MMKNNIKELKQKALSGDLSALEELRQLGVLSGNKAKYTMAPASYSQRRLWFIDKMDHSSAYNLYAAINLEGELNVEALENAFKEIVNRHEILRTFFVETDGTPYQKILSDINFQISKEDLSNVAHKGEKISLLIETESGRCFDLSKGPLMVCSLYRLEKEKHLLLFNMHHIISDGWSIGILISELTLLYNSFCKGDANPLSPLKTQYKDYVKNHSDMLNDSGSLIHKTFWIEKFSGELPVTELTPDFKRPLHKTFRGLLHEVVIEKQLYNGIKKLSRQSNASLFMFLVSAVNILLYKYTGKKDIIIGSPVSGREQRGLEDQIGFFVNTIPLRNNIDSGISFVDFLDKVKDNCIEAYDHQIYPLDLLIEELNLQRDTSRNPLFEIAVSLQEESSDTILFDGLKTSILKPEITSSKFDLHFNFEETAKEIKLGIVYNPDLYTAESIERFSNHFITLLENILSSPDDSISNIEIISRAEKRQIVNVFNDTQCCYPKENTIAGLFEEMAEKYPEKPAVVYRGNALTYRDLNKKANCLAKSLKDEYGLKLEEPAVILMDRSHELIISILAVLKAGGAYLPVDTKMPLARINTILEDIKARIVLINSDLNDNEYKVNQVIKVTDDLFSGADGCRNINCDKTSSNLAYILYTSGSTGVPKGSMIEEKSVIRLVKNTNYIKLDENLRIFSTSSISFDATTFDIWGALLNGGTLFFEDYEDYLNPEKLKNYFSAYKINTVFMSTGLFVRMFEADNQNNLDMFSGLNELIVGGDRLPYPASNCFISRYPGILFKNAYGPTENTTYTTLFKVTEEYNTEIPIGSPVSNSTVYIFNEDGNLCPVGVPGEIYIGGEGVSRGYVNRPELNKQKFVENPLKKGDTLYRSGDIAQWTENGNILFLGREDNQLKIRGFRIEAGEIENIAAKFKAVTNTKILACQEESQKELALYYTARAAVNEDDLKKYLRENLPDYMFPKYFIRLDKFPLNSNGKVDYSSFPKPETVSQSQLTLKPSNHTEKALTKIFEEILNIKNVSVTDNFFSLGGHSLKAIRAVSAIQKDLSVRVNLKEFFTNPDILSLENVIKDKKREELGTIPAIEESDHYDLSHAQKRLWVLDKIEKSKSTYNIPLAVTISNEIDLDILQRAFDDLVRRHESLRTVFVEISGEPFQKIIKDIDIPIIAKDFRNEPNSRENAFDYIVTEANKSFNLSEYPLVRVYVIKISEGENILFLNIHHIICDGWSLNVLTEDLFGGYKNYIDKSGNKTTKLKIQYKDYAYWFNNRINKKEEDSDREYWLDKLKGEIIPLELPTDFRRPSVKTYKGKSVYFSFSKELKKNLDAFNIEKRSSLFMTLTAALKTLLYKYSGKEDIIIGTPVAGRDHPDLENQIGYYVNTLALRDEINPEKAFAQLLEEIKKTATDAYSHQMYPFDKLVEEIRLPRDTSRSPLFDVMIVLQNFDISFNGILGEMEPYKIPMDISKFDLTFNFNDTGENLDLLIEYNTQLYKRERIEQIASHLFVLIDGIIANPAQSVKSIKILSPREEEDLLLNYNDTAALYPAHKTIVNLFEESAAKYPSNTAVVHKDKTLTYSQLNERSNKYANYIGSKYELSPGEAAGVLISPSENTPVILLAILKAGGAYLPIDPEYPDERIKHILAESKTNIIITNSENKDRVKQIASEFDKECLILNLDDVSETDDKNYPNPKKTNSDPDATAYVIFTSGSTGKPKGCPISHRNLVRLFKNDKSHFDFNSSDVWIMAHSYCFDFSVWEMYGALLFGGKLIIPGRNEVRDISAFAGLVSEHKVTVLNQTPGAFYKFIDTAIEARSKRPFCLRYIIFGGDKLDPSKLSNWIKSYPASEVKLINMYGITETTIHVTYHRITDEEIESCDGISNIGKPLPETKVYILDSHLQLAPVGVYGEIYVAGTGLSKGYLNRPDLTAARFISNPYFKNEILYKSGDVGRWLYDGNLEYLDRSDSQVQIRGYRVEINEIELQLRRYKGVSDAVVVALENEGIKELAAYIVSSEELKIDKLKSFLSSYLPEYMVPAYFIHTEKIPLTSNGKLDRKSLPPPIQNIATGAVFENPTNKFEEELLELWQDILSTESISIHDNFFDIGGNSILLVKLHGKIDAKYPDVMELTDLFSKSKIVEQAEFISQKINNNSETKNKPVENTDVRSKYHDVAIIGMASRIGSCNTADEFWKELCLGTDFIGEIPSSRIQDIKDLCKHYDIDTYSMKFRQYCFLNEVDKFDYGFFRLSPSEASLIDPGQRMFLETAYHALEDAGYGGNKLSGSRTGIFIGASDSLNEYAKFVEASGIKDQNLLLAAQTPSILASRLSYHLNLKGPAMLVDTACSSSLVAVHLACQSIREGKIDSAIVGGMKLHLLPVDSGSRIEIDSSDSRGHCFDDEANGTGAGEGVIAIFIKPLENALRDNDNVYAVIKGSEINQDGTSIGITAPDADAQADVIENAWIDAGVDPLTISYIETHGTATKLGDPIEIDGITKAFGRYTSGKNICAIGAVKANIGHLDTAAGLAGLLKAVLSLKYRKLTPLTHFKTPNRNINFEASAAYINKDLSNWERNGNPLRCGVSSFGLSGTNCHIVLEESPSKGKKSFEENIKHLFVISSRSKEGLIEYVDKIKQFLSANSDTNPESICYTLASGRGHYSGRLAILFENSEELIEKLSIISDSSSLSFNTEGIFYNYIKPVASNKKNLAPGEITETEIRDLSNGINAKIKESVLKKDVITLVAEAYVKGAGIDWEEYYNNSLPAKISLPGYPFEKNRCWLKAIPKTMTPAVINTPYGKTFDNVFLSNCLFETPAIAMYSLAIKENSWLFNEHRIMDVPALVGVAYLQIAYEAGKNHLNTSMLHFDDFYMLNPLKIMDGEEPEVIASINKTSDTKLDIEIHSKLNDNNWLAYSKFKVGIAETSSQKNIDIEEIISRSTNSQEISPKEKNRGNENIVEVSDKWNCLNKIYWNEEEFLAELSVPDKDVQLAEKFYLYPPLIDAALSCAIDEPGFLPFSFGSIDLRKRAAKKIFSHVKRHSNNSSETRIFDITLADEAGDIIALFRNFTLKKISQKGNYFHELVWRSFPLKSSEMPADSKTLVLYSSGCRQRLLEEFASSDESIAYEVVKDNFAEIFKKFDKIIPDKILFILPEMSNAGAKDESDPESNLAGSLYSVFNFAKFLTAGISSSIDILFVGQNVCEISGKELYLNSLNSAVAGLGQVIQRESPNLNCRFLDIDEQTTAKEITDEITYGFNESYYYRAYRNSERFIREFKTIKPEEKESVKISIKEGGVYVITGGTGGIGLELGQFLASQSKIKLVLLSRSGFLSKDKWDEALKERKNEKLCRKIEKLREIEKEASGVYLFRADVSDYEILKETIGKIEKDLGRICGVIHAAGIPGDGFIFGKSLETFQNVIKPKIHGAIYLSELLRESAPDFFVMTSALTAILPTSGQSDYTAANNFLDAYSAELNKLGMNALSINLTSWKETGMAYDYGATEDGIFKSISTKDAVRAFQKIIQKKINSVILGEPDFTFLNPTEGLPFYLENFAVIPPEKKVKEADNLDVIEPLSLKGREDNIYSEYETAIAQVWGTVLGYKEIDISDNYYDLGGDSIHAIKINSLLENKLMIKVSVGDLLNHLTVAELAKFLESKAGLNAGAVNNNKEHEGFHLILPALQSSHYPVSSAQRRLFILDRLDKDKLNYHIPEIWNITGKLNIKSLIDAFGKTVERHEILRTTFDLIEDEPVQIVHEKAGFDIPVLKMSEQEARDHIRGFIKPFDLASGPLFRVEIIQLSPENHLLLFDAHHIIIDAFSMEILKGEIFVYYEGREPDPLRIQYKDYAIWQNSYINKREANDKKSYWIDQFKGEIPVINLPLDNPRSAGQSSEAGVFSLCIDEKLTAQVKKLSSDKGVSSFMILLAVYNIVMHKYTNQDDVVIGVTTTGRDNGELSELIGMFVNNLPVRTFPKEDITVAEFLKEIKEAVINAFANQDYPFDELIENLNIKRDLSRSPLFDIVFSYMNFDLSEVKNGEINITDYSAETVLSSEYDLMLYGLEAKEKIYITIKYKKSLFKKESIERFAGHFSKTVEIITENTELKLCDIDFLLPAEIKLLNSFNSAFKKITEKSDVVDLINESAWEDPERTAVIYKDQNMSYRELNKKANKLANYLRSQCSVKPDDLVGIMLERTESMVVAMLGVIKSGAAYVGIDTAYPQQRIDYILKDSKAKILLTEEGVIQKYSFTSIPVTKVLDINDPAIWHQKSKEPLKNHSLENLAYVIYTSGTTGEPKGVAITHKNLSVFLHWCYSEFSTTYYDVAYASSSYCFDISVFEIFYSLAVGKTIRVLKSALEIPDNLGIDKNVLIQTVPSLMNAIIDDLTEKGFNNILAINLGGEQIPQSLVNKIDSERIAFRNLYGPSEDTTYSTIHRFTKSDNRVLIGKPISNTQIYIVDSKIRLVPLGHSGEICISGDGLARGYLYREEITNEKFIANPFGSGRLYRTGDLGRWTETGEIEFLGRMDRQVKIRGYRIELAEIESNIRLYPPILNAVAIVSEKGDGKDIAAYITANRQVEINDLKEYLGKIMPSYMIPAFFVQLEIIPLTPNGKIDTKALPEPELVNIHPQQTREEILNPAEEQLAKIWKSVLDVRQLSINDSFFDLGGHSLKAIRLLSQINREFKSKYLLSDVFEYPTIAQFAKIIYDVDGSELTEPEQLKKAEYYDVSHAQRRLWTLGRVEKNSIAYNVPIVYHLKLSLDINALQNAFLSIIHKHESLRTYFVEIDGEPKQFIQDRADFYIEVVEIENHQNLIDDTKELVNKAITKPFDLAKAPLIKVTLVKHKSNNEYILVINVHHIVIDEWSINILANELSIFYDHFSGKIKITDKNLFTPSAVQYKEYAHWQNRQLEESGASVNGHKDFWLGKFKEPVQCINLPSDYPRPKVQTYEGKTQQFILPENLSEGLKKLSSRNNTTLFITTLALINVLFVKYTGQNDIVIGTPIANRDNLDLRNEIGFFLNTLALRNRCDKSENFGTFLDKVKKNTLDSFTHQMYPFDLLVDELQLPRDLSHSPLFDVMLISQTPAESNTKSGSGFKTSPVEFDYPVSKFDLSISYIESDEGIKYYFEYNTSLFKKERIISMFSHFNTLVESVLSNEKKTISQLSIVSPLEMKSLMTLSSGTSKIPENKSIVSYIESVVSEFKDKTAVIFKRKKLTYEELNVKANRLSRFIAESKGIKPGEVVCVLSDRSEWSAISMLAILKAGCVYTPLDPNYPQSRIEYIIQDSGCKLVLASKKHKVAESYIKCGVFCLEEIEKDLSEFSSENLNLEISAAGDMPAYIIYTSGSTGEPKGVLETHKCLLNLVEWQSEKIESGLKTLQFAPHNFDVSVQEILFSLATSGTLVMIENETRYKMSVIAEIIEKEKVELITMPYSALTLFLSETENINQLKSLKHIITSGEQPYLNSDISGTLKALPEIMFHNQYGPSETHVVTSYTLNGKTEGLPYKIPIGRPVNNTQILLLDKEMNIVPEGIPGDLYVGGFNVAIGYINRPEMTRERFVQNPFNEGKLYKSGDIARWDNKGNLEFLGREDGQMKVRGYRIEPGEIESCMLKFPNVKEAAVKLTGNESNKKIAAYFTCNKDIETGVLKEFVAANLPNYMIPDFFVKLETFTKTQSGKVDLRSLPEPQLEVGQFSESFTEPAGDTEIAIAEVWREILHLDKIGSGDNFFEIGGNSIKAIQVMSKVQKRLGKKTYLNLIFTEPTIAKMARIILNTDIQLKTMGTDVLLLNEEHEKKVFFMPPGIGYSFAYMEFARYFDTCSVYGINFIESSAPAVSTAKILLDLQKEGEFYLFGHSAGGNMAYDVALELQNQGRQIGGIILLDSYRQLEKIDWSEEEYLNDAILYIEQNHAEFMDEEIKDAALNKIMAYRRYLNARAESEPVNCPVFQIEAEDEITGFNQNVSRSAWKDLTSEFMVVQGYGGHMDMLKKPNLEMNALLTKNLLEK